MSKNVAVFVDVANIFYAAKAAGVDIDYVTLLKSASAGRDLVRAYAYTGLDPDNENQRNFHSFLARHGYRVVSKDIRKYGDGKVKANLDIELVVDMMKTARNLDIAIVVSGDGDFAPAIRAVQEMGVRVEVISFRGNTSSDLIDVADSFTDITALAKVEKGSSRSGRRVAEAADEDLSMTEVPDKQTEGTGDRRRGGRGRSGRGRGREDEVAARPRRPIGEPAAVTSSGAPLVVLPGEKLSRAAGAGEGDEEAEDLGDPETGGAVAAFGGGLGGFESRGPVDVEDAESANGTEGGTDTDGEGEDADARRRRRRRGGRGRGRGRGREGEAQERQLPIGAAAAGEEPPADDDDGYEEPVQPRGPRTTPFGSVWDSQLGVPSMPSTAGSAPLGDDEDFEEPEIPEYLIAERRNRGRQGGPGGQGGRGGRGGPRGGRSAYAAAIERERYGRGGGGGGINRYPDVSGRERPVEPRRDERPARPAGGGGAGGGGSAPRRGGGDEPWSEVPPELEAMLRAQLGSRPAERRPERQPAVEPTAAAGSASIGDFPVPFDTLGTPAAATVDEAEASDPEVLPDGAYATSDLPSPAPVEAPDAAAAAPRRRTTRRTRAAVGTEPDATVTPDAEAATPEAAEGAAPKRRTTRRRTAAPEEAPSGDATTPTQGAVEGGEAAETGEAPKRRTTRRRTTAAVEAATPADGDAPAGEAASEAAAPAPKRRTTRRKTAEEAPGE